jgi:beta-lactamase regulating signal transducer with metallopeptidase domain
MNANLIAPEVVQRFAGSLLHFIWQGAAIALVTAAGLRMLRHRSAEARYAFAIGSLICMLAAPLFTVAFYSQTGAVAQGLILALNLASTSMDGGRSAATALHTSLWAQRILLTWCAGVLVFAARLVVGWRLSWQLVRSAEEIVTPHVVEIFEGVRERLGLRRPIRLLAHVRLDSALVVGWLRPVVLLPVSLISGFTTEQLRAILAHELAHIRRHDFIVNLLQRCVESILFYHPAVWWLSKRIRAEREHCCDDIAIHLCGSRKVYAEALIEMERARQPRPILSVAAADGAVLQRFRRVLGMSTSVVDWQSAVGTLIFLGVWIVVGMWQSASALQATPAVAAQPAIAPAAILPAVTTPAVSESVNAIAAILTAQPVAEPAPSTEATPSTQAAPAAVPASNAKGSIQGIVTRAGTTEPIPGAHVAVVNAPFDPVALATLLKFWAARGVTMNPQQPGQSDETYFQVLMDNIAAKGHSPSLPENQIAIAQFRATNTDRYSAMADAGGRFSIDGLAPGQYTLEAEQQGFFDIPGRQAIANVDGVKPADISVPLLAGGTITGRVKNAAGKFLPNVNVTAYRITYLNGKIIPEGESAQTTDDRGEYRMFWLPPGDYVVLADPPSIPLPTPAPSPGNAPAAGGPRGGAQPPVVVATPQFMRTFYPRSLTTTDAVVLAVKSGDQLSGMDITVQKATTYKISGEIHAAPSTGPVVAPRGRGNADPNAPQRIPIYLGLEYRNPTVIDMRSTNLGGSVPSAGSAVLTTSADGLRATFEVSNVLPGQYYLVPRVTQIVQTGAGTFSINRIPVDIDNKDVTGLAIELIPSRNVDGTLTIDGHPPGNVTVRVALSAVGNPSPTYQGIPARAVIPKPDDGTFTILNIPQTHYFAEMGAGLPPNLYLSDVRMGANSVFDTGFEIGKDPPVPLEVSLRSGAAVVEGVVRDGSNKPVANATIVVIPPDGRRENRELYKTAKSDAAGKFTVRGIAPGNYKLFAFEGLAGGEFYNSRFLSKYEFRGKPINLAQGGSISESLTVIESN